MFEETKALRRTTEAELPGLWEMAPSKLVPTVRAPLGRRKSRICICGNTLEAHDCLQAGTPEARAGTWAQGVLLEAVGGF